MKLNLTKPLIVFDLETTGLDLVKDKIIQISYIKVYPDGKEEIICDYTGATMDIGFKGTTLMEILTNLDCEEVTLEFADPSRPCLILPTQQPENEDILMLIMPMLLND